MRNYAKNNPAYDSYIRSPSWRSKAERRLELDGHRCCVCGKAAEEVHHLSYDNFGHEEMSDLVSLCRKCHSKAEEFYDPAIIPWAMEESKPGGNNFMAAMRTDAAALAPVVWEYLKSARGGSFDSLMSLRQPIDTEKKKYWLSLRNAVNALCRKRYAINCVGDRADIMTSAVENRVRVMCLSLIEHQIRNAVQTELHDAVMTEYAVLEKWKAVSEQLGITSGTVQTLRKDDGTSFGPSMREAVLYYCGMDAAAGVEPLPGFTCLTADDYDHLTALAVYMRKVSGDGAFKGEHKEVRYA